MIEYFCVGSTFCLRKATVFCKICFRMVCNKHLHHDKPDPTFVYCSKCKTEYDKNQSIYSEIK